MNRLVHGLLNGKTLTLLLFITLNAAFIPQVSAQESELTFAEMVPADTSLEIYSVNANHDTSTEQYAGYTPRWYDMITRLPGDWARFATESFQTKNIPLTLGIAGLTAGLMVVDNGLWQNEKRWYDHSLGFRTFSNDMVWAGDGRVQFGIVGLFAGYGFAFNNDRALRTASEITEAILSSGAVVQLLKHASGRERPDVATEVGGDWTFFPGQMPYLKHVPHYDAFPSGHIATATTTLVVIAENYPELTWFRPASYVMLGAISSSLVAYGIHWWSDIPLGIVLGYSFGEIASHPLGVNLATKSDGNSPKLSFEPVMVQDGIGMGVNLSF